MNEIHHDISESGNQLTKEFIKYREFKPVEAVEIGLIYKSLLNGLKDVEEDEEGWKFYISSKDKKLYVFSAGKENTPPQLFIAENEDNKSALSFVFTKIGILVIGGKPLGHQETISMVLPKLREALLELASDNDLFGEAV